MFQKVVGYFHKLHQNTMEHPGPISHLCVWFIWAAVKCHHASTRSKPKRESWARRKAQAHRFKQGTNITSTSRLWLLSPQLCRGKQDSIPKGEQPGRAEPCTAHCLLEQMGARDWKVCNDSSEHLLSFSPTFSSFPTPPPPFLSLFVRLQTYFHGPFNQNWKLKASQREWTLHFAKDLILSCSKIKKKNTKPTKFYFLYDGCHRKHFTTEHDSQDFISLAVYSGGATNGF